MEWFSPRQELPRSQDHIFALTSIIENRIQNKKIHSLTLGKLLRLLIENACGPNWKRGMACPGGGSSIR